MRKFLVFLFLAVVSAGAILYFSKEWLLKAALESGIRSLTGFDSSIRALEVSPSRGTLETKGLTILNPDLFRERIFADIPEFYIHLDPSTLLKGRPHLYEIKLHIRELNIEKDKQGISNISRLTSVKKSGQKKPSAPINLDRLELTLGRVSYRDDSSLVPRRLSIDMGIEHQVFEDIRDPNAIVHLILLKVIKSAPFVNLGVSPRDLEATLKGTMGKTFAVGDTVFSTAPNAASRKAEGMFNQVQDSALDQVGGLFGKFKSKLQSRSRTSQETVAE